MDSIGKGSLCDFDVEDYNMILSVIENENKRLQVMIEDVRVKKTNKEK